MSELRAHPDKYGVDPLSLKIKESLSLYLKDHPFSPEDKEKFLKCKSLSVHLDGITCLFEKRNFFDCKNESS